MESLELMVVALDEAEGTVHRTREDITKFLVENGKTEFFSVDWAKLRRVYAHLSSKATRRKSKGFSAP